MKLSWAASELDQDAAPGPEPVSFRRKFCEVSLFNLAQASKWKDQQIAWCEDKGEPSERLATHHTAAAADPERREALISPDSTRWNSVAQSSSDWGTYVCVSQAAAAAAATSLFWICETSLFSRKKTHDWWGPVMGRKVGCSNSWKKRGEKLKAKNNQIWNKFS